MALVSYLINYNFLSVALILAIVFLLIENRNEHPHGTGHIAVVAALIFIIVLNTGIREWFLQAAYNPKADYRGTNSMMFMYLREALEQTLFPLIAYVMLLLVLPKNWKLRIITYIPELVVFIAEIVNIFGPKFLFHLDKHLNKHDNILFLLPYFAGMLYMLLLLRYSIRFFKTKNLGKGTMVAFIVLLTLLECYLEAAYIVIDLMDEVVALDVIVYYFYLVTIYQSDMKIRLRTSELELEQSKRLLAVSQIQPHFMYNSLTSIIYLCDKDTTKTKNALIDFSKYLRQNVDAISKVGLVSIKDELAHTKVYLSLEKLRFDDDLTVEFDIQDENFMLPVLTVQPMVENAVKHGINASEEGCGTILISTAETDTAHKIIIRDDGAGFDPNTLHSLDNSHIGIANVRKRLSDECNGSLIINSEPDKGTECIILIPKEKHDENSGNR